MRKFCGPLFAVLIVLSIIACENPMQPLQSQQLEPLAYRGAHRNSKILPSFICGPQFPVRVE